MAPFRYHYTGKTTEFALNRGNFGYFLLNHFEQAASVQKGGNAGVYDHTFACRDCDQAVPTSPVLPRRPA